MSEQKLKRNYALGLRGAGPPDEGAWRAPDELPAWWVKVPPWWNRSEVPDRGRARDELGWRLHAHHLAADEGRAA